MDGYAIGAVASNVETRTSHIMLMGYAEHAMVASTPHRLLSASTAVRSNHTLGTGYATVVTVTSGAKNIPHIIISGKKQIPITSLLTSFVKSAERKGYTVHTGYAKSVMVANGAETARLGLGRKAVAAAPIAIM